MALARLLSLSGHDVIVWSALPDEIERIKKSRRQMNLPNMIIPDAVQFVNDFMRVRDADYILFAVPSVFIRSTAQKIAMYVT